MNKIEEEKRKRLLMIRRMMLSSGNPNQEVALDPLVSLGAVGVWYMGQYLATPTPHVLNKASTVAAPVNLISNPRRLFAAGLYNRGSNFTAVTDKFGTGPDGLTEATRVAWGSADAIMSHLGSGLDAGTYTLSMEVIRNAGSDQTFRFGYLDSGVTYVLDTITATSAWTTVSKTFTYATGKAFQSIPVRSVDSSTPGDILICNLRLHLGPADRGPDALGGHLILGSDYLSNLPTVGTGFISFGLNKYATAQFPGTRSWPAVTIIAIGQQISSGAGGCLQDASGTLTNLALFFETAVAQGYFNNLDLGIQSLSGNVAQRYSDQWQFASQGWHGFGDTFDGSDRAYWLDDIKLIHGSAVSKAAVATQDFNVGNKWGGSFWTPSNYKIAAIAIWDRALSDLEYRTAYTILLSKVASDSISVTIPARVIIAEGDSIIAASVGANNGGYFKLFAANANPICYGFNNAVGGSTMPQLSTRMSTGLLDAIIPPIPAGRKFIFYVADGHNDLNGAANTTAFLTNLFAYCDARRAAGWYVVIGTVLPSNVGGTPDFNTLRATANIAIRAAVGVHCDAIVDFDTNLTMGLDAAASNVLLYGDGTHPTNAGHVALEPTLTAVLNAI